MSAKFLSKKEVVVWGTGREGQSAVLFMREIAPDVRLCFVDEKENLDQEMLEGVQIVTGDRIKEKVLNADIVVKSPGISFYHPFLFERRQRGKNSTSLTNMWLQQNADAFVVGITGSKGKSTTTSLLAHVLNKNGVRAMAVGNIGVPLSKDISAHDADCFVLELSSYQCADLCFPCKIGVVTTLFPEHLDWHRTLPNYYRDKANLLCNSQIRLASFQASEILQREKISLPELKLFAPVTEKKGIFSYQGEQIREIKNAFLRRKHNLLNVAAVLSISEILNISADKILSAMETYEELPHRQHSIMSPRGYLLVDDSISTAPEATMAAIEAYSDRAIVLIVGGYDRGLDYEGLSQFIFEKNVHSVICMGESGRRLFQLLKKLKKENIFFEETLERAIEKAKKQVPPQGAIILSPAAPSYDQFKSYEEKGKAFVSLCLGG
ncbi:MAG: UDP-N-acetylmuramoyl-L-alanine--D-glutamate ligase [Alphaproteobacteria bacterium]|nr:UDP-N-acetylmuramoyl-L-alanine--D-glutamate ligase [Alphaproteobacteria bacterium]